MKTPTLRSLNYLAFIVCAVLLTTAYYIQIVQHIEPCLLCLLQRWLLGVTAAIFLIAALHNPSGRARYIYAFCIFLIALFGTLAAGRQVWLEHLPPAEQTICAPGVDYLLKTLPATEIFKRMIQGTSDCSQIKWTLFGLSMAMWMLIFFILIAVLCVYHLWRSDDEPA